MTGMDNSRTPAVVCHYHSDKLIGGPAMTANLPPAAILIEAACTAMNNARTRRRDPVKAANKTLDQWAPAIDAEADSQRAADFLGYKGGARTVSRMRAPDQTRADGTPGWPERDNRYGRSDVWRYRTIVLHMAGRPGQGRPGAPRSHGRLVKSGT